MPQDTHINADTAPFIDISLGSRDIVSKELPDGTIYLRSAENLKEYPRVLTERLLSVASSHPERTFIAQRDASGGWASLTYAQTVEKIRNIGQALLDRGLSTDRPLVILSAGSISHALLSLAATHVGVPFAPVSPAYSLLAKDFKKLDHVLGLLTPGLVFVEDASSFDRALKGTSISGFDIVANLNAAQYGHTDLAELIATQSGDMVDEAHASIKSDDLNKMLFTSGSTGPPKGVINTHRMICSNQQMFVQSFPLIQEKPPIVLSWLPWHHTSGANTVLGLVIYNAGTLYIDEGKPVPELMKTTVENLSEIAPTAYFSAPSGFHELIPYLREQPELRKKFFSDLQMFFYSGSTMPDAVVSAMDKLAVETVGARIPFFSCYGATETAPFALTVNWPDSRSGLAGLPMPGAEFKLMPVDGSYEACTRGPNVTQGYWRQPELSKQVFDEEGYYHYGDAVSQIDPDDLRKGLVFDGRMGENFKLTTGTWVSVAALRGQFVSAAMPLVTDMVIAGEGHDSVSALIFPDLKQVRKLTDLPDTASPSQIYAHKSVRAAFQKVIDELARESSGSSTFIARAILLADPPSNEAGELTDKGSVSQKILLKTRKNDVNALYAENPSEQILIAGS